MRTNYLNRFATYASTLFLGAVVGCGGSDKKADIKNYIPPKDVIDSQVVEGYASQRGFELVIDSRLHVLKDTTGEGKKFIGLKGYVEEWRKEEREATEEYIKRNANPCVDATKKRMDGLEKKMEGFERRFDSIEKAINPNTTPTSAPPRNSRSSTNNYQQNSTLNAPSNLSPSTNIADLPSVRTE